MKKKIFLTSAIAMGFVVPAFAEPFPTDGYMAENKTYDEAATFENTGVYDGEVDATAEYDNTPYSVAAGSYFTGVDNSNEAITAECTAGSYCPGVTSTTYDYTTDLFGNAGIQSCPTDYALSAEGASSQNECYRACTTSDVEHSTGVSGGYYYGNNNQCEPTGCVNGWHLKNGVNGTAIATAIGNTEGVNSAMIDASGTFSEKNWDGRGARGQTYYGLTDNNTWAVEYGSNKGMLMGQGRCSTQAGDNNNWTWTNPTIKDTLTDETGQDRANYCYCNVTGYKDASGTLQSLSSPWVFYRDGGNGASYCASYCARDCADRMLFSGSGNLAFRAALLGTATSNAPSICEANTITINWDDVDPEYAGQNNEGTATYGEDVRTPVKANTYKGKTFKGWRFSKPTTTQLPE